jgi:hypothetical protein
MYGGLTIIFGESYLLILPTTLYQVQQHIIIPQNSRTRTIIEIFTGYRDPTST